MDIGRGIAYIFEDSDWLSKVILGGLISLVPILNFATYGYYLQVLRQIMAGNELPLPEWDELGKKWKNGLVLILIMFVWALPALVLMGFSIIPLLLAAASGQGDSQTAGFAALGGMMVFMALGGIYLLLVALVSPAIVLNYAREGGFGSGFRFGQIFSYITANIGGYLTLLAVMFGVSIAVFIASSILSILLFVIFLLLLGQMLDSFAIFVLKIAVRRLGEIALIFLGFLATLVYAHYLAQYYRANFAPAVSEPASPEGGAY